MRDSLMRFTMIGVICFLALTSCSTTGSLHRSLAPNWRDQEGYVPDRMAQACRDQLRAFDKAVTRAGVKDAEAVRVTGFPYLRTNRFLTSFRTETMSTPAFDDWLSAMRELDREGRFVEWTNLQGRGGPVPTLEALERCADTLMHSDQQQNMFARALRNAAVTPDHYSFWMRLGGMYPLTNIAASIGYGNWQEAYLDDVQRASDEGRIIYAPKAAPVSSQAIRGLMASIERTPLGMWGFTPSQKDILLQTYAPLWAIGTESDADRFGAPQWQGGSLRINTAMPQAYSRIVFTRFGGEVLPQLVYMIWFPERPKDDRFDIEAGFLDGLIWRVTLNAQGEPLLYDSIHPCGCYQTFFPTERVTQKTTPEDKDMREAPFSPFTAPALRPGQRINISVSAGDHYITGLDVVTEGDVRGASRYTLGMGRRLPDQALRMMPDGRMTRSLYNADGLVPQSARLERFILWPMGIASAGAMRQWGTHATAFVGERHFDDAFLMDHIFDTVE